jgi:hypothetical protein
VEYEVFGIGSGLGPVHRSTGPVEMLPRVQKLYKIGHVATSQRVQYSYALKPNLSLWNQYSIDNKKFAYLFTYLYKVRRGIRNIWNQYSIDNKKLAPSHNLLTILSFINDIARNNLELSPKFIFFKMINKSGDSGLHL